MSRPMGTSDDRLVETGAFRAFARTAVAPGAALADRQGRLDPDLVRRLAEAGYLGACIPREYAGGGFDDLSFGQLCLELGRVCVTARSLVTVQNLVGQAIVRWGSTAQRQRWLPALATGESIAAFCLSEPTVGADASRVETRLERRHGRLSLTGTKSWVSFGTVADLFLVVARADDGPTAILVDRGATGLQTKPLDAQLLGMRGAGLATVELDDCVPDDGVLGPVGLGFSHVAASALDHGRHSIAWGCAGIAESCLEHASRYALEREQFGSRLAEHQLVRRLLSEMVLDVHAARLMCTEAAEARVRRDPSATLMTVAAKHFCARAALATASSAVEIHGARGLIDAYPIERHFRDARVMQIIEGTEEMNQLAICELALREYAVDARAQEAHDRHH